MKEMLVANTTKIKPNRLIYFTTPYLILILLSLKTPYFRYLAFGFVFLFITAFILSKKEILINKKYLLLFWFLIGYFLLGNIYGSPIQISKNVCMFILSLAPFFIFDWVFSKSRIDNREQNVKFLIKVITPVLLYTIIATLYYLLKHPYIARYMTNFDPSLGLESSLGISIELPTAIGGGYILIYGVILLPALFLFLAKNLFKSFWSQFFSVALAIFILYFIIKAGFTIAFILSIVSSILSLFLLKNQNIVSKVFIIFLSLGGGLILLSEKIISEVIHLATIYLPTDSIISIRLQEIVPTLYGADNSSSFSARLYGIEKSWNAFIDNPFLGVGYKVGFDYYSISKYTGLHTEWLDLFSQYGLFLGIPFVCFIFITLNNLVKLFNGTSMESIIKLIVLLIVIVGFFNPILNTSIFILGLLYIPSILTLILNKNHV